MVSVSRTLRWGGFCTERRISIEWMQRWSIQINITLMKYYCCWSVRDSLITCSPRFWSHSQILTKWSAWVTFCWRSWTRVFVWERHSSTTVLNAWVKWGTKIRQHAYIQKNSSFWSNAHVCLRSRRRACVSAVENAQQKAREVSLVLGQTLGPPLLIREEETREWRNAEEEEEEEAGRGRGAAALPHLPRTPTITASSRVSVSFSLRDRSRKNLWGVLNERARSRLSQFQLFYCLVDMAELKCSFKVFFLPQPTQVWGKQTTSILKATFQSLS